MSLFDDWCEAAREEDGRKRRWMLSEKAGGRVAIRERLIATVRSHYDDLERIAEDVDRLGFPAAAAILAERLPRTSRARSGELGEILATELIEDEFEYRVPVRRLRYKDGREMALRGDDFLGVKPGNPRLHFIKGEAKSRRTLGRATVTQARAALSRDEGRPTATSLLFVADRLLESDDEDDENLGRAIRDEVGMRAVPPARIAHGLFTLSGNNPARSLTRDLDAADGRYEHISVNLRIEDHQEFIADIYEEVSELGDD